MNHFSFARFVLSTLLQCQQQPHDVPQQGQQAKQGQNHRRVCSPAKCCCSTLCLVLHFTVPLKRHWHAALLRADAEQLSKLCCSLDGLAVLGCCILLPSQPLVLCKVTARLVITADVVKGQRCKVQKKEAAGFAWVLGDHEILAKVGEGWQEIQCPCQATRCVLLQWQLCR